MPSRGSGQVSAPDQTIYSTANQVNIFMTCLSLLYTSHNFKAEKVTWPNAPVKILWMFVVYIYTNKPSSRSVKSHIYNVPLNVAHLASLRSVMLFFWRISFPFSTICFTASQQKHVIFYIKRWYQSKTSQALLHTFSNCKTLPLPQVFV